jgi:hypothetical protein
MRRPINHQNGSILFTGLLLAHPFCFIRPRKCLGRWSPPSAKKLSVAFSTNPSLNDVLGVARDLDMNLGEGTDNRGRTTRTLGQRNG